MFLSQFGLEQTDVDPYQEETKYRSQSSGICLAYHERPLSIQISSLIGIKSKQEHNQLLFLMEQKC